MNTLSPALFSLLLGLTHAAVWAAEPPAAAEFTWRASLTLPAAASVARLTLPAEAMLKLQSSDARDVRVFNAEGVAVAFALTTLSASPHAAPAAQTRAYKAYPLFAADNNQRPAKGAVAVHLDQGAQQSSVWVRFAEPSDATQTSGKRLPAILFDTRGEKQALTALALQASLPANALVHFALASSADLVQWTPVELRGPVFRFDGADAPSNQTLELVRTLQVEGRYLRLSWEDQPGVQVNGFTGAVARSLIAPERVRAPLASPTPDGANALRWNLDFATPLAALQLSTSSDNTLLPFKLWGRNDSAQAWRPLSQGVVFRLGTGAQTRVNPPLVLGGTSVRQLRVEASNGMALPAPPLQASVEFEPVQIAFLASGTGPFELAVGRANTAAAAVDPSLLTQVLKGGLDDLPLAQIGRVHNGPDGGAASALQRVLPAGTEPRSVLLWAVLLAGVLALAGVAYALMRQLSHAAKKTE